MLTLRVDGMPMRKVADVVARLIGVDGLGGLRVFFREQGSPVLGDRRRVPVNFHPHQPIAEPVAMCQRTLHARMRGQIAKAPLERERLA